MEPELAALFFLLIFLKKRVFASRSCVLVLPCYNGLLLCAKIKPIILAQSDPFISLKLLA
jgi:hypothetical protein